MKKGLENVLDFEHEENEIEARLSLLNDLLNKACLKEMRIGDERKILDIGSGLGQFTRSMAKATSPSSCPPARPAIRGPALFSSRPTAIW